MVWRPAGVHGQCWRRACGVRLTFYLRSSGRTIAGSGVSVNDSVLSPACCDTLAGPALHLWPVFPSLLDLDMLDSVLE